MVKPRLAGFMMSMISAITSTAISVQCARDSGASSGGETTISCEAESSPDNVARQQAVGGDRRRRRRSSAMPTIMSAPIGMPASTK